MKKIILVCVALLMAVLLAVSVFAGSNALRMSSSGGQLGHTVFLTVELTESIAGDTMGITYSFDDKLLEALPESCEWAQTGILQDFNKSDTAGVWATDKVKDLSGTVCTLAFKIRTDAKVTDTKVTCKLIVKNGANTVATYTATGTISISCDHEYGQWIANGSLFHKHTCTLCGNTQSQSHTWDNGVTTEDTQKNVTIRTYTCTLCGATKKTEVPITQGATQESEDDHSSSATVPTATRPTGSSQNPSSPVPTATRPPETQASKPVPTESTRPVNNGNNNSGNTQQTSPNQGSLNQGSHTDNDGHNHVVNTIPVNTGAAATQQGSNGIISDHDHDHEVETTQDPHAGHDHSTVEITTSANQSQRLAAAIGIFVVLGLFLVVSVLVVKRKR